jgi:hypothetical protein
VRSGTVCAAPLARPGRPTLHPRSAGALCPHVRSVRSADSVRGFADCAGLVFKLRRRGRVASKGGAVFGLLDDDEVGPSGPVGVSPARRGWRTLTFMPQSYPAVGSSPARWVRARGICRWREVLITDTNRKGSPVRWSRVWWVLVPAGLTAAAALGQLAAEVVALSHR